MNHRHLSDDELIGLLYGVGDMEDDEDHLAGCPECGDRLRAMGQDPPGSRRGPANQRTRAGRPAAADSGTSGTLLIRIARLGIAGMGMGSRGRRWCAAGRGLVPFTAVQYPAARSCGKGSRQY